MQTIQQLKAERREKLREARALSRQITDDTPDAEARKIERKFNEIMLDADDLADRIEDMTERAKIDAGDSRRPFGDNVQARGDGREPQLEIKTAGLRPHQRMADHVREQHREDAETYGDLEIGRFLRAIVTGGKTDLERRALAEGTDSAGGYTVPTIVASQMIDLMRANSVAVRAGATTMPLDSDQTVIAKLATDPTVAWRSENAAINESDPVFSAVTLTPRSLAVLVKVSRELIEDSVNIATELPNILARAMATEWDRVALLGSGSAPEPEGIANVSGISTTALSGNLTSYAPLVTARTSLLSANHTPSAIVMHPRDEGTLAGLVASDSQPLMAPRQISDIPMLTTTAIPTDGGSGTDESSIFMGDFSRLMLGVRSEIRVEVVKELYAANHQLAFIAHMRGDIGVSHPEAFHVTTAVTG